MESRFPQMRVRMHADDLGVRRPLSRLYSYGRNLSGDDVQELVEEWGAFKKNVAYYIICAERI